MHSPTIQKLIDVFSKLPTVGPRTASRFVFYLLKLPDKEFNNFVDSIKELKKSVKICSFCFNPFDASQPENNLCPICENPVREKSLLCVVEKETDLISIEKTKNYKGIYFILGDAVSVLENNGVKKIRIAELEQRIENPEKFGLLGADFKEIIIAANPTPEGEATTLFLQRKLIQLARPNKEPLKITKLGRGLPLGGEVEYADEETLKNAFEGRK